MSSFGEMNAVETVFLLCAIGGGFLLILRLIMQFAGLGGSEDAGAGDLGGHDGPGAESHGSDPDASFKLFSLLGLTAFFLMFGLVGLTLSSEFNIPPFLSILGGAAAGVLTGWLIGKLFFWSSKLQSSGTFDLTRAIGSQGEVYLSIPADGIGKVQVVCQGRFKTMDARSQGCGTLQTGARIKVVGLANDNTLIVEPAGAQSKAG